MTFKHTPGPWTQLATCVVAQVPCDGGKTAAVVAITAQNDNVWRYACSAASVENAANGRLIEAAPDMLDTLLYVKEFEQHPGGSHMPASAWFKLHSMIDALFAHIQGDDINDTPHPERK